MIPRNITREHVLKALREIDINGVPKGRDSRKFVLLCEGKAFPPKYVVSLANKYANGIELDSSTFSGGKETNKFLMNLEFEILDKSTSKALRPDTGIRPKRIPAKIRSPWLEGAKENLELAEEYAKQDREILWGEAISLSFKAVMNTLQGRIVDLKGIKVIEQLRKNKKVSLDVLIGILQKEGLMFQSRDLDNLRHLRNLVEHPDIPYVRQSKKGALYAFNVARSFISQIYPEIFKP